MCEENPLAEVDLTELMWMEMKRSAWTLLAFFALSTNGTNTYPGAVGAVYLTFNAEISPLFLSTIFMSPVLPGVTSSRLISSGPVIITTGTGR